ncbi:MAG TPA: S1C family serine protease [Terrimesophilobacter sp.]|uniref:S1C family serine protease n=1 Tax=Terrimesophilobacter sp. TaxID=2906435 RepID=UPI002F957E09
MFTHPAVSARPARVAGLVATAAIASFALSSCAGITVASGPSPVDFKHVQSATIQIQAQGTFVPAGTTQPSEQAARGSGFIIDASGIAVTNNHVVVGAGTLKVWLGGDTSKEYNARVLGASECLDLAVIQLDKGEYPFMAWRDGKVETALDVYSAGFPLGDPVFTMTRGIVSKNDVPQDDSWASLDHVIEHDARIRGGNSGGPLVDPKGRVVGVNYAGRDDLDYNYAIHRDQVLPVLKDLAKGKPVLSLGINAQALAPADDGTPNGIWIESLAAGGPADSAGIEPGDVLIDMAGITMAADGSLGDYCQVLKTQGVDATIDFEIYRPADNSVYQGQFNGKELKLVSSGSGGNGGGTVDNFVTVTDDSGTVSVTVPNTWSQVDGASFEDGGSTYYDLTATTNLEQFNGSWTVPGVRVTASTDAVGTDPNQVIANYKSNAGTECTLDSEGPYDDGYYLGQFAYFSACGGTGTDLAVLATKDADNTHLMIVLVQMVSAQDKDVVLSNILTSFQASF